MADSPWSQSPTGGFTPTKSSSGPSINNDVEAPDQAQDDRNPFGMISGAAYVAIFLAADQALPCQSGVQTDQSPNAVDPSWTACRILLPCAMHHTTSFTSSFDQAPIAAYTMLPDSGGCEPDLGTEFLPNLDKAAGRAPTDSRNDELVVP